MRSCHGGWMLAALRGGAIGADSITAGICADRSALGGRWLRHIAGVQVSGPALPVDPTIVRRNAGRRRLALPHCTTWPTRMARDRAIQNTVPLSVLRQQAGAIRRDEIGWLGTPTNRNRMYIVWHTSKVQTPAGRQDHELMPGARARLTPIFYGRIFNQIMGLKARFITGYPGQNEILLAWRTAKWRRCPPRSGRA